MKFSKNWLRELVNPPISTDELAKLLTMAGYGLHTDSSHRFERGVDPHLQ